MWVFNKLRPGDKLRNPIQGEFFATSTIDGPAQALVRECIQNSLDAKIGTPVHVRIAVHASTPADPDKVTALFDGAWEHLAADGNGISKPKPMPGTPCPWLVVEDFNTSGLTGDPEANDAPARDNHFFNFFRAEGVSGKSGASLGRWGIGKFVFPRSSRASTHFALTVPADTRQRLLLGSITLLGHRVEGEPRQFTPDGLYGNCRKDGFVLPITSDDSVDAFRQTFAVTRDHEPGTSVVVPFIDPRDFTMEALLKAVAQDYFFPILDGRLTVRIVHDGQTFDLDPSSVTDDTGMISVVAANVLPLIRLAKACTSINQGEIITLKPGVPEKAARWSEDLMDQATCTAARERLKSGSPVVIRVPVTILNKETGAAASSFDLYLQNTKGFAGRPVFVREGIIISDVRARRTHDTMAMVVVNEGPLAVALGNAENPAHTQWQKDGSKFRNQYKFGSGLIDFVTRSVAEVLSLLHQNDNKPDAAPTIDFFSVKPVVEGEPREPGDPAPKPAAGSRPADAGHPPQPRPTRLTINRRDGGFGIRAGTAPPAMPFLFKVRFAYETRAGNALKAWEADDFTLGKGTQLAVTTTGGVKVITSAGNRLVARVDDADFELAIDGFDPSRDLYVRTDIMGGGNGNSQA